jgi:hypothetical protein
MEDFRTMPGNRTVIRKGKASRIAVLGHTGKMGSLKSELGI